MTKEEIFQELTQLLDSLKVSVKYGRGFFRGGLYRYKDETVIYLNRADDVEDQIGLILSELRRMDLEKADIRPEIQQLLFNSYNKQEVKDVG